MSTSKNKATLRRHVEEVFHQGNLSVADEIISPDYVYHGPMGEFKGVEGFKQMVVGFRQAFPDVHYTIDEMVAEGDKVAARYTMTATFKGELMGMPPTGKQVKIAGAFFYRFKGGKEVEALPFSDMLTFYQQLGIPIPAQ